MKETLTPFLDSMLESDAKLLIEMMAGDPLDVQVNKVCDLVAANSDLIVTRAFGEWTIRTVKLLGSDEFEAIVKRRKHEAPKI